MPNLCGNSIDSIIQAHIQKGRLTFTDFMQLALYEPQFGYYTAGLQKFGRFGDFITAPELSPLYGQTLAKSCQSILKRLKKPILFEFGAGSGALCVDILKALQSDKSLPEAYYILELSADLVQRQQERVQKEIPEFFEQVHWLKSWPKESFEGIMIANEVLDAMPVARFKQEHGQILESTIEVNESGDLFESFRPCQNQTLFNYLQKVLPKTLDPYISEVNLFIEGWIAECATLLKRGVLFIIDYGFPRHEYYHPERDQGTIMCHYQHRAHGNFLAHPGQQDITAHVDFTAVAEAALNAGLEVQGYTNQASFLLSNGILDLLESIPQGPAYVRAAQAVKELLQPQAMGELFKVMALTKDWNWDWELRGFELRDARNSL